MKKILIGVAVVALILAVLFTVGPFSAGWPAEPVNSETGLENDLSENKLSIEPVEQLTISQGKSDRFIRLTNETEKNLSFKIDLAHIGLTLEPREDTLPPGATRNIYIHVADLYPTGRMSSIAYLLSGVEGENMGMEAVDIYLRVEPGELKVEEKDGKITVFWNDKPAPPGTTVYFRSTEIARERWLKWDEVPLFDVAPYLYTGTHSLQFMAKLGEARSSRQNFDISVQKSPAPEEPLPGDKSVMKYLIYLVGTDDPETLEYMGYTEDMDYMDILFLIRRLDSEGYEEYRELLKYWETIDILAYIEFLIEQRENENEEP